MVEGRLVGSVRAKEAETTCYIGRLIVHPDFQGKGIGSQLMKEIEASFPEVERFELFTGHKSADNIRFYNKRGYVEFKRQKVSSRLTLIYMQK